MLKLDQFRIALLVDWLMLKVLPDSEPVAAPPVTQVVGPVDPQVPAAHGVGSSTACAGAVKIVPAASARRTALLSARRPASREGGSSPRIGVLERISHQEVDARVTDVDIARRDERIRPVEGAFEAVEGGEPKPNTDARKVRPARLAGQRILERAHRKVAE